MNNKQTEQFQYWIADNPADAHSSDLFEQAKAYDLGIGVEEDKHKAASLYREAMNQGDKRAKHNLALLLITDLSGASAGIRMLQELADEGEAASIYSLGGCYMNGRGVKQDTDRGLELYHTASAMGLGVATYSIAAYYLNECNDLKTGIAYCEKAVEQGFALAASILAQVYREGIGVERDADKEMAYLKRGAELGDPDCQLRYGVMLYEDEVDDNVQSVKWMLKSARQKLPAALIIVGQLYLSRGSHLFADPHHFSKGVQMLREAAALGGIDSSGFLEHYGLEHEQSLEERMARFYDILNHADDDAARNAFQQIVECCEIGDPIALCILGIGHYYGNFVKQDKAKGMQLLKKAADSDCVDALNATGLFLNEEKRYEEAFPYHKRSAELGDMYGLHNLGNAYFYARGVECDVAKAIDLWHQAAEKGNPDSHFTLGNIFFRGELTDQNIPEAIRHYTYVASRPCATQQKAMEQLVKAYSLIGDEEKAREWNAKLNETEG